MYSTETIPCFWDQFQPSRTFFRIYMREEYEKSRQLPKWCLTGFISIPLLTPVCGHCSRPSRVPSSCQPAKCSCFTCLLTFVNACLRFLKLSNKRSLELAHQQRQLYLLYKWPLHSSLQKPSCCRALWLLLVRSEHWACPRQRALGICCGLQCKQ